jgi:hypothetical protein
VYARTFDISFNKIVAIQWNFFNLFYESRQNPGTYFARGNVCVDANFNRTLISDLNRQLDACIRNY